MGLKCMDNIKDDNYYIKKISEDLKFINEHMKDVDFKTYDLDLLLQDSMMFRMIQISENAKKLTDEYKEKHDDIPWSKLHGLRNYIVYDYGNTDISVIYQTLTENVPEFLKSIGEDDE